MNKFKKQKFLSIIELYADFFDFWFYVSFWAIVIKIGIDIMDNTVLRETKFTEREVSAPNFEENIVVIAAAGAEQEISKDTSISPLTPQIYIPARAIAGNKISL